DFTTSSLNGVQKLASAVISPTKRKIGGAIFVWLFLLLVMQNSFFTTSFYKSFYSLIYKKQAKCEFSHIFFNKIKVIA
ncbi:hypothetical protein ACU6UL_10950, partial [Enterococcus faecium]|uniref:hypothetical protein n=1 Tax=Enterococcus faecium TaxID=1352 RepID=UPI00391B9F61